MDAKLNSASNKYPLGILYAGLEDFEISLDAEFNSTSNDYPHKILFMDPLPPKKEIFEKM